MYHLGVMVLQFSEVKASTMSRTARGSFALITCAASLLLGSQTLITCADALLLGSQTVSKLPPAASFCSANHFCDGNGDYVTETMKEENLQENLGESKKRESEENEKEEMVRQQYEDFPSPEVTLKQLEDEKQR